MKGIGKKIIAVFVALGFALGVPMVTFASTQGDTSGNWWVENGGESTEVNFDVDEFLDNLEELLASAGIYVDIERSDNGDEDQDDQGNNDDNDGDEDNGDQDGENDQDDQDGDNGGDEDNDEGEDDMNDGGVGYNDILSTVEGQPFYGSIKASLTTSGKTGVGSALALSRFPVADSDGDFYYERTFTVSDALIDSLEDGEGVIVQHGIDYNDTGKYDGDLKSALASSVPLEATAPAACGAFEWTDDEGLYAELHTLNDDASDAHARAWVTIVDEDANQIKVSINSHDFVPGVAHAQHIHVGAKNTCPPASAADSSDRGDDDMNNGNGDNQDNDNEGNNGNHDENNDGGNESDWGEDNNNGNSDNGDWGSDGDFFDDDFFVDFGAGFDNFFQ